MIARRGKHSLCTGKSLVFRIWSLICIRVDCTCIILKKIDGQYGFVQMVAENMKLFTKRQIDGALKTRHLYETLGYPSNANFESVLRAGGIGGCSVTVEDAKVAQKIWGSSVPRLKGSTVW